MIERGRGRCACQRLWPLLRTPDNPYPGQRHIHESNAYGPPTMPPNVFRIHRHVPTGMHLRDPRQHQRQTGRRGKCACAAGMRLGAPQQQQQRQQQLGTSQGSAAQADLGFQGIGFRGAHRDPVVHAEREELLAGRAARGARRARVCPPLRPGGHHFRVAGRRRTGGCIVCLQHWRFFHNSSNSWLPPWMRKSRANMVKPMCGCAAGGVHGRHRRRLRTLLEEPPPICLPGARLDISPCRGRPQEHAGPLDAGLPSCCSKVAMGNLQKHNSELSLKITLSKIGYSSSLHTTMKRYVTSARTFALSMRCIFPIVSPTISTPCLTIFNWMSEVSRRPCSH